MTEPTAPFFAQIDHVVNGVYIGGYRATHHADELARRNIRHVLKLYADEPYFPAGFTTLTCAIEDGIPIAPETFQRGVKFINEQTTTGHLVLVMCGAGISRSATFVLAYMVEAGFDLHAAYMLLREAHPAAAPHPNLWVSLFTYYGLNYSLKDSIAWMYDGSG